MEIFKLLSITLGAILANNFIFSQFLGCCPFLGVSKKVDTAVGMGVAVTFVMGLASAVCFVVNRFILIPLDLAYMQTVAFILVIASLVQFIEMFLQKSMPSLYTALGVYLPLIVVNCIILGRAEMFASKNGIVDSALDGIGMGIGYTLTVTLMASIREILGSGTWLGFTVLPESMAKMSIMTQAPGAFFCYGVLMAGCIWLEGKLDARIERKSCCDLDNLKKEAE